MEEKNFDLLSQVEYFIKTFLKKWKKKWKCEGKKSGKNVFISLDL